MFPPKTLHPTKTPLLNTTNSSRLCLFRLSPVPWFVFLCMTTQN